MSEVVLDPQEVARLASLIEYLEPEHKKAFQAIKEELEWRTGKVWGDVEALATFAWFDTDVTETTAAGLAFNLQAEIDNGVLG